jgi:hypothetical protein
VKILLKELAPTIQVLSVRKQKGSCSEQQHHRKDSNNEVTQGNEYVIKLQTFPMFLELEPVILSHVLGQT